MTDDNTLQVRIENMVPIEPGNPFISDHFHMGQPIGTNLVMMYTNHDTRPCPYLIFVDTTTGNRVKLVFDEVSATRKEKLAEIAELIESELEGV
jgi:hypothetical protein